MMRRLIDAVVMAGPEIVFFLALLTLLALIFAPLLAVT